MNEELKIAIEELDALIIEFAENGMQMTCVRLAEMRKRIFDRVNATMPESFAKPATPSAD